VAGLHGDANLLNYDDYIWNKYKIGEWLNVVDPATRKPAAKNLFYRSKDGLKGESASKDPDDPDSIYQDTSMQALQVRGVQLPYRSGRTGTGPHSARLVAITVINCTLASNGRLAM
jgi:hypothetical protein